jgi:ubiquinone/menaquinone biosynthesis C-methylase UbiE|tara:strand:- start:108 stop:683 length:576 start_codon:yes stop_codon:yes gene_type:complete
MPRPDKQIFYDISLRDINTNKYLDVLDICCGKMDIYKKINNLHKYTGIDFDEEMVNIGLSRYPNVKGITSRFEDFNFEKKFDLAICFETIGINKDFKNEETLSFLTKIKDLIRSDGYLAINFGDLALPQYKKDIIKHINENYQILNTYYYGKFHKKYSYIIYKVLYYTIKLFPFINKSKKNEHIYFFLKKK